MRVSRTGLVILLSWALAMASCGEGAVVEAEQDEGDAQPAGLVETKAVTVQPDADPPAAIASTMGKPATVTLEAQPFEEHRQAFEGGRIRWRAAYVAKSTNSAFGGYSGLLIEGDQWLALSDRGTWWSAELRHDADGTLVALDDSQIGDLVDVEGAAGGGRDRLDAEELALCASSGDTSTTDLIVSFEGIHRLHRYPRRHRSLGTALTQPPLVVDAPDGFAELEENGGMEAVTCLEDGQLLVFSETGKDAAGNVLMWLRRADGSWRQRLLLPSRSVNGDFQPTSVTTLPSGELLLVERTWSALTGVRIRLSLLDIAQVLAKDPRPLRSIELARFASPMPIDNMEAVDVRSGPSGETLIYLLADDNFNLVQRTVLLQLELLPAS